MSEKQSRGSRKVDDISPIRSANSMSDEDDEDDDGSWEGLGSFPSSSNHDNNMNIGSSNSDHIFADEPVFVANSGNTSNYYSLEIVQEGSREETSGGAPSELMSMSASSSEQTPATSNTAETMLNKQKLLTQPLGGPNSNQKQKSNSFYPYNMYQSLDKSKDIRSGDSKQPNNVSNDNSSGMKRKPTPTPNTSSIAKGSWGSNYSSSVNSNRKNAHYDKEEPSSLATGSSLAPQLTPMSPEEESLSVYTTEAAAATNTSYLAGAGMGIGGGGGHSVVSTRSYQRHHHHHSTGKRSYMVRHTLATSQQVNANPSTMLKNLFIGIEGERHMHKLTSQNLRAMHNWLLFLPSILLALFSGLLVLIFEAELPQIDDNDRVYASIVVGILALSSVFMQAVSKQLDWDTRAALHDITSIALKRLSEDILLTLSSTDHIIPAEYVALIGEKFSQALDVCCASSTIPYKLETAFSLLSDRMVLILNPPPTNYNATMGGGGGGGNNSHHYHRSPSGGGGGGGGKHHRAYIQRLDFMHLYMTAYDELASEIIHSRAWPFVYPQPRTVSDAALRNFKTIITEGREAGLRDGRGLLGCTIRYCCPCLLPCSSCCCGNQKEPIERSLFDILPYPPHGNPRYSSSAAHAAAAGAAANNNRTSSPQDQQDAATNSAYSSSYGGGEGNARNNPYSIRNFMLGQEV